MPKRRYKNYQSYSRIPWILLVLVLVAAGGGVFYSMERYGLLEEKHEQTLEELASVKTDRQEAREKVRSAEANLDKASVDTRTNRGRFKQSVEEADELTKQLAEIVGEKQSTVDVEDSKLIFRIRDTALFASGSAKLSKKGVNALDKIGAILADMRERDVWIEGHTSDDPVKDVAKGFDTNWEYSAAQSMAVIRHLQDEVGIPPERLAASSFAEFRPVSRTEKLKNRRIDIVLVPKGLQRVGE